MDERTAQLVQQQVRRSSRSLLQYVAEASPWTSQGERETMDGLRQMILEEQDAIASLMRLLRRVRVPPPYLGPYPEHFMTYNFLSMDRLLPLLVEQEGKAVVELSGRVTQVQGSEAHDALTHLLNIKRRHLASLEELHKKHPQVGVLV
jgi:hypothetical protein